MRFRFLCTGVFALVTCAFLPGAAQAQASFSYQSPSEQYLSVRRLYPPAYGVTASMVAEEPERYRGTTMEIEGLLAGTVQTSDGGALLMLTTDKNEHLNLNMSLVPTWVQPGVRLRILLIVTAPAEGEVVAGIPDMQVVALASASDIAAAEERWQAQSALRNRRSKQRDEGLSAARAQLSGGNRSSLSSRSGSSVIGDTNSRLASYLSPTAQSVYPLYRDFVRRYNPRLTGTQADAIAASILLYSEKYDLDPRLMVALIIAESDFRPQETSNKGAMGLGQLMKDEADRLRLSNPYDPVQNIAGVSYLLKERLIKYSGSGSFKDASMQHIILALASYNAGMGAVKKYGGVPPYRETQNYVKKIERIYRELCQGDPNGTNGG